MSLVANSRYKLIHEPPPVLASRRARAKAGGAASVAVWQPYPDSPQERACASEADEIGYGGAAGSGKSDLLLGIAGTRHQRSIIFRRVFPSLRGLIERSREIFNAPNRSHLKDSYNESLHVWRLDDGRTVEFGAVQYEQDRKKFQGNPHDLVCVDEATELPEATVRFLSAWNRTTTPGQRCRLVLTFNPPMDDAGAWVVRYFAPWLDTEHPNPAVDGELRYYAMVDGEEQEYTDPAEVPPGVLYKSRTFFHAKLSDNPILEATGYGAIIDAMPEPLRSTLKGSFNAARVADPYQVIPAAWVRHAQARWTATQPDDALYSAGVDVARGGKDKTVLALLYGRWVAPLIKRPGIATPDGPAVASMCLPYSDALRGIHVDVIGVGASAYDTLKGNNIRAYGVNFAEGAGELRDKSGRLKFRNVRAAAYWKLREALDPDHGDNLALPPDPELLADLCAPRWSLTTGGILIESKDDIVERLGRSPDCGDALALAYFGAQYGKSNSAVGAFG